MKRSRWFIPTAILILAFVLLAGCQAVPVNTPDGSTQSPGSSTEGGPIEIEFWTSWAPEGAQGKVLQQLLDEYNASQDGAAVEHVFMGEQRNEKIAAGLAANDPPDIAWIAGAGEAYFEADQLVSMDRVLNGEVLSADDFISGMLENNRYLGQDISIPFENSNLAVYYNKQMLDEQGLDYPPAELNTWTWSDFTALAKQFSDPEAGTYGWDPRFGAVMANLMLWSAGGQLVSDDLQTNLICTEEEQRARMVKALERLGHMVLDEKITAPDVGDQGFASGDMPLEITGPWALPRYIETNPELDIGIAALPADEETGQAISYWYQKALALFKTNEAQEEATLDFIKWFYSPEIHARWSVEAGYLPITISASEHTIWQDAVEADPRLQVFMEQAPIMRRVPMGVPLGDINLMVDTVILGEGTPEEAVDVYCQDAQLLLDDFWTRQQQ